jgi:hypothetical protein
MLHEHSVEIVQYAMWMIHDCRSYLDMGATSAIVDRGIGALHVVPYSPQENRYCCKIIMLLT